MVLSQFPGATLCHQWCKVSVGFAGMRLTQKFSSTSMCLCDSTQTVLITSLELRAWTSTWKKISDGVSWLMWVGTNGLPKLEERWAALKSKVSASTTHRSEYLVYICDTWLMISWRHHQATDKSVLKVSSSHLIIDNCTYFVVVALYLQNIYKLCSFLNYQSPLQVLVAGLRLSERPIDHQRT